MTNSKFEIPIGYSAVPRGCIANVATFLEMNVPPRRRAPGFQTPYRLLRFNGSVEAYRSLFRKVGENWLWLSRLAMPDEELRKILSDERVEVFELQNAAEPVGLLELDFRQAGECELAFFGLARGEIGKGLGRALMDAATEMAWAKPIKRFWVHTCTLDHPGALAFYLRSGFKPYGFKVEVQRDPRLTGLLPADAAPHIPLIKD
jgi:GNAT superfamily N-acetyltransferase